jgi:flagellar motor component MotA
MEPLCTTLGITMNELISGERLSEDAYSAKAEENIMTLMNENATNKKSNIIATLIGAVLLIAAFALMMTAGYGYDMLHSILFYLDLPSFIILAMMSCGCVLVSGKRDRSGVLDVLRRVSIPCGVIVFFITIVVIMGNLDTPETLGPNLAVAILSVIYATIEYLVVVLIQARVK